MGRRELLVIGIVAAALLASGALASPYTMYKIDNPAGPEGIGEVVDFNNSGTVLYSWRASGPSREISYGLWNKGAALTDITVPGVVDRAAGINDFGQVAVQGTTGGAIRNADGSIQPLLDCPDLLRVRDINNAGQVAAHLYAGNNQWSIARLSTSEGKTMVWEGTSDDYCPSVINDSGSIAWWALVHSMIGGNSVTTLSGFVWDGSRVKQLPSARVAEVGDDPAFTDNWVWAMNNVGQVAGRSGEQAVIWNPDGTVRVLGKGDVFGINDLGQAVGRAVVMGEYGEDSRGALWNPDGSVVYLDDYSEGGIVVPMRINNQGQIAGTVRWDEYRTVGAMWEPVPEPSSVAALACGMLGLCGVVMKRKKI